MKNLVVDANVAIKWLLPENHAEDAIRILKSKKDFLAPDFIWVEVANVFWKKTRQKEIEEKQAQEMLRDLFRFSIQTCPSKPLLAPAMSLASQFSISVYDALYLALAVTQETVLVTADRKMFEAVNKRPFISNVAWIEDI